MERKTKRNQIDLVKLSIYILKRAWLVVLCAEIGFGVMYYSITRHKAETYTASGTMYVNNGSDSENYYSYASDLNTSLRLINTYLVVIKSDKVMGAVTNSLKDEHPGITNATISSSLSMESVSESGVVSVISRTGDAQLSADIVNAVMSVAPNEIIRVVGAGNVEILDYATVPIIPDRRDNVRASMKGAGVGAGIAVCILALLYLINQTITDTKELTDNYKLPVLASIKRLENNEDDPSAFMLTNKSPMDIIENYSKLRMNLLYTLVGKESNAVVITSAISGEGKSTIAANLAISCAMGGKKVVLIDGDMRRACQRDIFKYSKHARGLSDILVGNCTWKETVIKDVAETLDLLPAGHFPPNPSEMLESEEMHKLISELGQAYEIVLLDMPPINIVADPLVVSAWVAGCLFVTRQNFSDHRDIRKSLTAAEMTGMNVLGFVFYGENINQGGYYSRRYYRSYYNKYDYRKRTNEAIAEAEAKASNNQDAQDNILTSDDAAQIDKSDTADAVKSEETNSTAESEGSRYIR